MADRARRRLTRREIVSLCICLMVELAGLVFEIFTPFGPIGSLIQLAGAGGVCWFVFQSIARRNREAETERQEARVKQPPR